MRGLLVHTMPSDRADVSLSPAITCCGREFTLRRAYENHVQNHTACDQCAFTGCKAALKRHSWEAHGSTGAGLLPAPVKWDACAQSTLATGSDTFACVIDEPEAVGVPLEHQFPEAEFMWSADTTGSRQMPVNNLCSAAAATTVESEMVWPSDCPILLILGPVGSGKTRLLRSLLASATGSATNLPEEPEAAHWPSGQSILDGLGRDAIQYLGAVGLGSVPLWCQPYAALSTGEAFRAELARRLQDVATTGAPLAVDSFCDHLDPLSAACCAASLARHLRGSDGRVTRAVFASSHTGVAHALKPDGVLLCGMGGGAAPILLRNVGRDLPLPLRLSVHGGDSPAKAQTPISRGGGELFLNAIRTCGLQIHRERCFDDSPSFRHDAASPPPTGGVVLAARVEQTDATRACNTLFDLPHDGVCAKRLPPFPTNEELSGAKSAVTGYRLGLICGPSGSSKSALLGRYFGAVHPVREWTGGSTLGTCFRDAAQASRCLRAAGLAQVATDWYAGCSAGEMAQVGLALALAAAESPYDADPTNGGGGGTTTRAHARVAVWDEFGSAWDDETTARIARALSESLRTDERAWRLRCQAVVLAGCHPSLLKPLAPDWCFEAASAICIWFSGPAVTEAEPVESGEASCSDDAGPEAAGAASSPLIAAEAETAHRGQDQVPTICASTHLGAWASALASLRWPPSPDRLASPTARVPEGAAISIQPLPFELSLARCDPSAWRRFHPFHYKTPQLSTVATTFLLEAVFPSGARIPVGFIATIPHSGRWSAAATAPPQRAHRTVVLPEWQGLGIGSRLSDAAAEWHHRRGSDYYGQTAHPRFGAYRDASPLWAPTEANHTVPQLRWLPRRLTGAAKDTLAVRKRHPTLVYAHRYIGAGSARPPSAPPVEEKDAVAVDIAGEEADVSLMLERQRLLESRLNFLEPHSDCGRG